MAPPWTSVSIRYPVGTVTEGSGVTLYHETSNADDILARLRDLTRYEPDKSNLKELASRGVLSPFARLETQRRSYRKGEVNIVVDATDWGYRDTDECMGRNKGSPLFLNLFVLVSNQLPFQVEF